MDAAKAAKVKTEDADSANGVQGSRIAHTLTAVTGPRSSEPLQGSSNVEQLHETHVFFEIRESQQRQIQTGAVKRDSLLTGD